MAKTPQTVDEFMLQLEHPLKAEIEAVRRLIRVADPTISEGIKWSAPSFCCVKDYFATVNIRRQDGIQIILHLGAKVRSDIVARISVADPDGLLEWLAKDRASVQFKDGLDIKTRSRAFQELIRQWIVHLKQE